MAPHISRFVPNENRNKAAQKTFCDTQGIAMPPSNSVTNEKRLRAGNSVWERSPGTHLRTRRFTDSTRADVVIVGAGVTGAFMAYALAGRYDKVVVVDRRLPAHGSTTASTAMLQWEIDTPLTELHDKIGTMASRAWRRSYRATQNLVKLVETENLRCGLARRQSLYLAGNDMGFRGLETELKARKRAGLAGEYLSAADLRARFGIDRTGAILSPGSAIANPVQLATGLLRRAMADGVQFYSPVEIENVVATQHGVILDTGTHFIEAKHAIFCTGYELLKGLPTKGTKITSSWAIATPPRAHYPKWLDNTVVWEASTPYLYMRTTPDGRLVVAARTKTSTCRPTAREASRTKLRG